MIFPCTTYIVCSSLDRSHRASSVGLSVLKFCISIFSSCSVCLSQSKPESLAILGESADCLPPGYISYYSMVLSRLLSSRERIRCASGMMRADSAVVVVEAAKDALLSAPLP